MKHNLLLVDDDESIQFGFSKYFMKHGFGIDSVSSLAEARQAVQDRQYDAVLLDLMLPDGKSVSWIPEVRDKFPGTAIVVISGHGDVPAAVEAVKEGADNFLTKPVSLKDLKVVLEKSLEIGSLRRRHVNSQRLSKKAEPYFGSSDAIKKVLEMASLATENDSTVLINGETGAGKGVLGRWIHDNSPRNQAAFVEINCSGLKGELFASELFGHAKGAFTSATQDKPGLIEVADGGTLFLDEISDMPLPVQAEFLNVIEERNYRRLGEVSLRRSEFKLICSTNRELLDKTTDGSFRQDLYFRINVFPIRIPSLRERMEDLDGLVSHLLASMGGEQTVIGENVMQLLRSYSWPGNIRELKNVLERAILLARGGELGPEHFTGLRADLSFDIQGNSGVMSLEEMEGVHIKSVMARYDGDARRSAEALGVSLATLYRKLKKISSPG
ncbi:MAG: sigma-54-dependent Fis family transcriptional regulator [Candidatus Glassbacteria bacterium]|nr:sigma-54-dependent Fis family transcriptional regulator [Candidatus Glassbacteria bacterium]